MKFNFPALDDDGYPTDEVLEWIENYNPFENGGFSELLEILVDLWRWDDYIEIKRPYKGRKTIWLHTGGWSGNESIINALNKNVYFWINWKLSKVGGHYKFSIPTSEFYDKH